MPEPFRSSRRPEPAMSLEAIDAERVADMARRHNPGGRFDHSIKLGGRQAHALMTDSFDVQSAFEELGQELLASDRIVGEVVMRLFAAVKGDCIFDVILG